MKVLTNLTAVPLDRDYQEPPVFHFSFGSEPVPGYRRTLRLGPAGLMATDGKTSAAIPMTELWKLFETAEPQLAPPAHPQNKIVSKTDLPIIPR